MAHKRRRRSASSARTLEAKVRGLKAINRKRRGESESLFEAARAEGTSVETIRKLLPAAIRQDRRGGPIRVTAGDSYSAPVEIVTDAGVMIVNARGSRERTLAGQHRSVWIRVLRGDLPADALEEFRGATVGGHTLASSGDQLFGFARGGELDQLDALYVSPGA